MVGEIKDLPFRKAQPPIDFIEVGIVMVVNDVQSAKI